jgi:hypothetical protein
MDLKAAAVALGWTRLELARTAIVAVTAAELDPFDVPVNPRHGILPRPVLLHLPYKGFDDLS